MAPSSTILWDTADAPAIAAVCSSTCLGTAVGVLAGRLERGGPGAPLSAADCCIGGQTGCAGRLVNWWCRLLRVAAAHPESVSALVYMDAAVDSPGPGPAAGLRGLAEQLSTLTDEQVSCGAVERGAVQGSSCTHQAGMPTTRSRRTRVEGAAVASTRSVPTVGWGGGIARPHVRALPKCVARCWPCSARMTLA